MDSPIVDWLQRSRVGVDRVIGNEIKTHCPICGRQNFYFNAVKLVGYCHHAKCGSVVSLDDLIKIIGYGPDDTHILLQQEEEDTEPQEIDLSHIPPVLLFKDNQHLTHYPDVVDYLHGRGLSNHDILRFDFRFDGERVYLPIRDDNGTIRQYVSRLLSGNGIKYKYASGRDNTRFILGWAECKLWNRLTIVENSFVSIWLRNHVNCSTCFGSHLSEHQADLIKHSKIQSVAILFDEGAEPRACEAVRRLKDVGVPSSFGIIVGQPDNYLLGMVVSWAERLHDAAKRGIESMDFRGESNGQ